MRRSAAPSQLFGSLAKKPRFIPPGKMNTVSLKKESDHSDLECKVVEVDEQQQIGSGSVEVCSGPRSFNSTMTVKSEGEELPSSKNNCENLHLKNRAKSVYITGGKPTGTGEFPVKDDLETTV